MPANFDFFRAPAGPDSSQQYHDVTEATLAKGHAASTGLVALQRYFEQRNQRQHEERQFNAQLAMREMLAQQEMAQSDRLERGRNDRAAATDRRARETADNKQAHEQARSASMARAINDIEHGGLLPDPSVGPPNYPDLVAGDHAQLATLHKGVQEASAKAKREERERAADATVDGDLLNVVNSGYATEDGKVRGQDLTPGYENASGHELQARALEKFGPTQPEAQKAWVRRMTKAEPIRHLNDNWEGAVSHLRQQYVTKGGDPDRFDRNVKSFQERTGLASKDKAYEKAREAFNQTGRSEFGGAKGEDPEADARRAEANTRAQEASDRSKEDQALQMKKEDPHGLLAKSAKGPVRVNSLDENAWVWAEEQSRKDFDRDPAFVQASVGDPTQGLAPNPAKAAAIQREFAKRWLIAHGIVSASDKAFSENQAGKKPKTLDEQIDDALDGAIPK